MRGWRLWMPLAGFAILLAIIAVGLFRPADRTVRSALVGKPLPRFALPPILPTKAGVSSADGGPRLLNIFASWCIPCMAEAPQLMRLKAMGITIDAVAIRDTPPAVRAFLARNGDPYRAIGDDPTSSVQFAIGSSGVPETFVIDRKGVIVAQHVGDIRPEDVEPLAAAVRAAR